MRVVVVGAGGHARSVIDALRTSASPFEVVACTDPDVAIAGASVDGVPVIGGDECLPGLLSRGVGGACLGVGAVGDNRPRTLLFDRLHTMGFNLPTVVHGRAYVSHSAALGPATVVLAGAIVGAGAVLGCNVIVNTGAIVEHDCVISDHAHLASGSVLGGAVDVEAGAHIGLGACVLQQRRVGADAIVGAGSLVIRDVAPGETVFGSPATARSRDRSAG